MKSFRQFQEDGKGFKGEIGKSKIRNKIKKQDARTAKEKRRKKLDSLESNPSSWKNLESYDPRTPSQYFVKRRKPNAMRIVEQLMEGKVNTASSLIKREIESKISKKSKVQKGKIDGAKQIEMDIFGD